MALWREFTRCASCLAASCTRRRTGLWMMLVLVAWAARPDLLGVTSFVRASFLQEAAYYPLLAFFHSGAAPLAALLRAWVALTMTLFQPVTERGRVVFVADGIKAAKEGRKMPAVKCLHQESENNSKPEYIMGHSFQVLAVLVSAAADHVVAVPLLARLGEGLVWRRSAKRKSQVEQLAAMFLEVTGLAGVAAVLVADAYYANRNIIEPLVAAGHHLVSRARRNTVAYEVPPAPKRRGRGRPKKYGRKVRLRDAFKAWHCFLEAPSPVYGERGVVIQYRAVDLLWRPVGRLVRFVLVKHPTRGSLILISSDVDMDPLAVIRLYGLRFKIEVSFKQAVNTLGTYAYHFWMKAMAPIRWGSGDQHLEGKSEHYLRAVRRKVDAYHRYVQIASIAQGLLQHLAINFRKVVWASFRSWLRTMNPAFVPSEMVVAQALRAGLAQYLLESSANNTLTKFILARADGGRLPAFHMAA